MLNKDTAELGDLYKTIRYTVTGICDFCGPLQTDTEDIFILTVLVYSAH